MEKMIKTWKLKSMKIFNEKGEECKSKKYDDGTGYICFNRDGYGFASSMPQNLIELKTFPNIDSLSKLNEHLFFSVAKWKGEIHNFDEGSFTGQTILATTPRGKEFERTYHYSISGDNMSMKYNFKKETSLFDFDGYCLLSYENA